MNVYYSITKINLVPFNEMEETNANIPYGTKIVIQEFMALNMVFHISADQDKNITSTPFSMLTPEDWKMYCGQRILTEVSSKTNPSSTNTPYDPRLGSIDPETLCPTCGIKGTGCQNHFGCVKLEAPLYNRMFFAKNLVPFLNCVCMECGELKVNRDEVDITLSDVGRDSKIEAYKKIFMSRNISECYYCKAKIQKIIPAPAKEKRYALYRDRGYDDLVSTQEVYDLLCKVKNHTLKTLGFLDPKQLPSGYEALLNTTQKLYPRQFRPEAMMWVYYPVLPVACRPWIDTAGVRNDDDLTELYNLLIKTNNILRSKNDDQYQNKKVGRKGKEKTKEELVEELQSIANAIITSADVVAAKNTKKKKGILDRLIKKEGHINSNVSGKRCEKSCRGVIVGAGYLVPMGWIGVPRILTPKLLTKDVVTAFNLSKMQRRMDEGRIVFIKIDGSWRKADIIRKNKTFNLKVGVKVQRHLEDGDPFLWNRQPSLRPESEQGMRAIILDDYAFRMPTSATRAYNADYDGDEMNGHVPQMLEAAAEMTTGASSSQCIVASQNSEALMGCVQNALIFHYVATNTFKEEPKTYFFKTAYFYDAVLTAGISLDRFKDFVRRVHKYWPEYVIKKKGSYRLKDEIPGKIVCSIVFPEDFYMKVRTGVNPDFPEVEIVDGIVQPHSGPLCKKIMGGGFSAVHYIWQRYSASRSEKFITEAEFLAYRLVNLLGFSVGISDSLLKSRDRLEETIKKALDDANKISTTETDPELREKKITTVLNNAMNIAPVLASTELNKGSHNSYTIMRVSGTKGNDVNTGMISAMIAQQNIDGQRIKKSITGGTRTLPHFPSDEAERPMARGFIERSYINQLRLEECFVQAQSGRRGVIDTAAKTASSGYASKRIGKKTQDALVAPDGSVRTPDGAIISYLYGGDGMDTKMLTRVSGISYKFFIDPAYEAERLSVGVSEEERVPISEDVIDFICDHIHCTAPDFTSPIVNRANENIRRVLKSLMLKVRISEDSIVEFGKLILTTFNRAKIAPGSAVGMQSSLNTGELSTQQTMNTFHNAGAAVKDVTLGLPRLTEIIDASKNQSKPTVTFEIGNDVLKSEDEAYRKIHTVARKKVSDLVLKKKYVKITDRDTVTPTSTLFEYRVPVWRDAWLDAYLKMVEPPFELESWGILLDISPLELYATKKTLNDVCNEINKKSFDYNTSEYLAWAIPSPLKEMKILVCFKYEAIRNRLSTRKGRKEAELETNYNLLQTGCLDFLMDITFSGKESVEKVGVEKLANTYRYSARAKNLWDLYEEEGVRVETVYTTDFWEAYEKHGIVFASQVILNEFIEVVGSSKIDPRHLSIIVGSMCRSGTITSANRHGIKDTSIISRVMFETPHHTLSQACMYSKSDNITSVSSAIFTGSLGKFGTGSIKVLSN